MAGRPIQRATNQFLTANEEQVFAARASGETWKSIAAMFATDTYALDLWLRAGEGRWKAWKALEEIAAESRASEAREILDQANSLALTGLSNPDLTRLAIARSDLAKWEAGVMARNRFAPTAAGGGSLTINVGALHLTAVKQLAQTPPPVPAGLLTEGAPEAEEVVGDVPDAEFEVVVPSDALPRRDVLGDDPALVEMSRRADEAAEQEKQRQRRVRRGR